MIRLTVYGTPVPKGSRTPGFRKDGTVFTRPAAAGEHAWVDAVARTASWKSRVEQVPEAPYLVDMAFYMPRPKRPTHAHPTRGDLDKLVRAVLDGLVTGGLLVDDRHVTEIKATKEYATAPGGEQVFVVVSSLAELQVAA